MKPGVRLRLSFSIPELYLSPYPNHSFTLPYPTNLSLPLEGLTLHVPGEIMPRGSSQNLRGPKRRAQNFPKIEACPARSLRGKIGRKKPAWYVAYTIRIRVCTLRTRQCNLAISNHASKANRKSIKESKQAVYRVYQHRVIATCSRTLLRERERAGVGRDLT